jgi:hypothetical protein
LDTADRDDRRVSIERRNEIGRQIARRIVLDELHLAVAVGRHPQPRPGDRRKIRCHGQDLAAGGRWDEVRNLPEQLARARCDRDPLGVRAEQAGRACAQLIEVAHLIRIRQVPIPVTRNLVHESVHRLDGGIAEQAE